MTIANLSANFRPQAPDSGKSLPQIDGRVPSNAVRNESTVNKPEPVAPVSDNAVDIQKVNLNNSEQNIDDQIKELQEFNQNINRSLQFKVDEELGVTIVRVVDKDTDELIRQFPPEELLNLSKRLKEVNEEISSSKGIFLKENV